MAATVDFVHDEEIADAILGRLRNTTNGLPSTWLDEDNPLLGCQRIEFGEFNRWRFSGDEGDADLSDLIPSVLVRFATSEEATLFSLIGAKQGRSTVYSVVHIFGEDQCRDETDASLWIQPQRAKAQKAKIVSKAIWNSTDNNDRRRLDQPTLTTADTEAHVIVAEPGAINYYPPEDTLGVYAFAVVLTVTALTT